MDGIREGHGKYIYITDDTTYTGEFKDGIENGLGRLVYHHEGDQVCFFVLLPSEILECSQLLLRILYQW